VAVDEVVALSSKNKNSLRNKRQMQKMQLKVQDSNKSIKNGVPYTLYQY
jgi:hypothetical protein